MSTAPPPYSPSLVDADALDACTVGHERLIDTMVGGLTATAREGGARFELIVGPSGSGKTHMLRSLYRRVKASTSDGSRMVMLPERAVVPSLTDLLGRTIETLIPSAAHDDSALRMAKRVDDDDAVELLESRLAELVAEQPLFLFVEDLGDILEAAGVDGEHRLRAMLQHRRNWSIVTTGTKPSSVFTAASAPLFGTFAIRPLPPLTSDACHQLRARRGEGAPPTLATTRACHHLFGGLPRSMVILQQQTATHPDCDIGALLMALCEALEPELVFAERQLPLGRRSVFRYVANRGWPTTPSDIGDYIYGISRSAVSTQLKILRNEGLLRAHRVSRSMYYEVASPIHRLVAVRRAQPQRLLTLARFLRSWYGDGDDPDLGGRNARRPADALFALDLTDLAGLERDAVAAIAGLLELRDAKPPEHARALSKAQHAHAQSSAAERLLLDQCLAGAGRANALASS